MDVRSHLSSELTRIIECPYPASLSKLEDLLTRADEVTIRSCIHDLPPCAVLRLATLMCDALPLWAHTSHILQLLCCSPEFTEKLFLHSPGLLNALLTKANSSQHDFDDYLDLCVQLLSRPLPESISLPAAAQSFFLRAFERATQDPDVKTLQPVYRMLNGACRKLLGLLPADVRQQFDRELCHILSSNSTGQNSMLLLWCFGIVILTEHPEELGDSQHVGSHQLKQAAVLEKQWKTASGRKLFGSSNGLYKTINLTYLSVIWATKGDVGVSDAVAIEGIRIAVRTLHFVDVEARAGWPNSSALARNIFPKLPAKILREGIHPAVQLEALCFYALIAGANNLPSEIVTQYQSCLSRLGELANAECLRETLMVSLPNFAPQMQDSFFRTLLTDTLDACASGSTSSHFKSLVTLVDMLSTVSPSCAALSTKLLLALSSSTLQDKIWAMVRTEIAMSDAGCRTYATALHREAFAATISLILSLAFLVRSGEISFPHPLATALIMKQRKLPHIPKQCSHATSIPSGPSISFFQQEDRLKSELEGQNSYQRDSIVRSVAQICQDLETRCNTVEEPLRREKSRSQELERHVEKLCAQVSSLESQATDDRFHLDGLEDEKLGLADERDRISNKLDELREQFDQANRDAEETLRSAQEEYNTKELELQSLIVSQGEQLRLHEDEVSSLEHAEEELRALSGRYEDLQAHHGNTSRQLDDERELQERASELEAIELKHSSKDALREMEIKHTTDIEAVASEAEEERNKLNTKLTDTIHTSRQLKDVYDKTRKELHDLQSSFSTLETRTEELDVLCGEQEEELEELRTLRRNVLASMGLATQNPLMPRSATHLQKEGTVPETPREPREHKRRKPAIQTQDLAPKSTKPAQCLNDTAIENDADASFDTSRYGSQDGPTPKRQKPRPSLRASATQTPFNQKLSLGSRSASRKLSPVKRSALRQMSPNRRHTTVGFALSETHNQAEEAGSAMKMHGSLYEQTQEDFDVDDFLAGTPFTPGAFMSGTGRLPEEDDATTTEL
ncbi:hypothetical protein C7974DRAFT_435763 [Boeremia exigua]|uniref:uncharacterized protein n=1 Tax=Boeremia exigua TaxID=749465 RepID=UPI001E8CB027|nr:uncharacterized protein C7974DRAFT_435763 [Boeremia exigua]KAH6620395.1 hypothetical protein C7974DRAFT_435763 [Boeremia exigua]